MSADDIEWRWLHFRDVGGHHMAQVDGMAWDRRSPEVSMRYTMDVGMEMAVDKRTNQPVKVPQIRLVSWHDPKMEPEPLTRHPRLCRQHVIWWSEPSKKLVEWAESVAYGKKLATPPEPFSEQEMKAAIAQTEQQKATAEKLKAAGLVAP